MNNHDTVTTVYDVTGMTCGHCEGAVTAEIETIEGVTDVVADASTGRVTVTSHGRVDPKAVHAAVDEAGYALT